MFFFDHLKDYFCSSILFFSSSSSAEIIQLLSFLRSPLTCEIAIWELRAADIFLNMDSSIGGLGPGANIMIRPSRISLWSVWGTAFILNLLFAISASFTLFLWLEATPTAHSSAFCSVVIPSALATYAFITWFGINLEFREKWTLAKARALKICVLFWTCYCFSFLRGGTFWSFRFCSCIFNDNTTTTTGPLSH